jgi:sugar phosphate isomerase/epimerase
MLPLAGAKTFGAPPQASRPTPQAFTLGVATVSLKSLPLDNMLAAVKRVGLETISLHRAHSPWENQPGQWKEIAGRIRAAGIAVRCCGVLYLKNDEVAARRMMEYVKTLGLSLFSCNIEPAGLPLLEKLVREYDLRAAIHNHGPEDKLWAGATNVWEAIQSLDTRIGLCLDTGHSYRAGEDPAELLRRFQSRVYDVHLKDSAAEVGKEDIPVEMGRGKMNLSNILTALIETGYRENVWFEYEKDPNDPIPGLAESAGYVRGLLRGLSAS